MVVNLTHHDEASTSAATPISAHPSPNNPPWNSVTAILVWLASIALIAIIPGFAVFIYVSSKRNQIAGTETLANFVLNDPTAVLIQILAIVPVHLLTFALSLVVVTRMGRYDFREMLGWNSGGMRWFHYASLIIGVFAVAAIVLSFYPEAENDFTRMLKSSRSAVYATAVLATFTAPLVEEVVYRGILYSALQRTFGEFGGIAVVTMIFSSVHILQYWPSYSTLAVVTMLSFLLTLVRWRTRNLWPCVVLHTIFNGVQSLLLVLEPIISRQP